ncbi:MAG: hypothetical protein SFT94_06860 [Pseudanabaenaceae cyanobacterium bins.68]|nr:hypothetical protein [Pseudanabaenaceae cyanobacterium bins.68]
MTFEQMQALIGQMLEIQRQLQENQLIHTAEMAEIRAVANSNARAIEALGNKVSNLIEIVGDFAESTNTRLNLLENQ